jgi:transcriptional regulator with XRE-family HTH domain
MPTRLNVDKLRAAAKAHGDKTDTMIAARTGISPATISQLAKPDSKREPKVWTFRALGRPYGMTVDDLILDDDAEADPEPVAA